MCKVLHAVQFLNILPPHPKLRKKDCLIESLSDSSSHKLQGVVVHPGGILIKLCTDKSG